MEAFCFLGVTFCYVLISVLFFIKLLISVFITFRAYLPTQCLAISHELL